MSNSNSGGRRRGDGGIGGRDMSGPGGQGRGGSGGAGGGGHGNDELCCILEAGFSCISTPFPATVRNCCYCTFNPLLLLCFRFTNGLQILQGCNGPGTG